MTWSCDVFGVFFPDAEIVQTTVTVRVEAEGSALGGALVADSRRTTAGAADAPIGMWRKESSGSSRVGRKSRALTGSLTESVGRALRNQMARTTTKFCAISRFLVCKREMFCMVRFGAGKQTRPPPRI